MRWPVMGFILFLSIPVLIFYEQYDFNLKEPYYTSPITTSSEILHLRNDSFGKGFFGAPRNGGRMHAGIDLESPVAGLVLASKSGRVTFSGEDVGYGNYIELRHPDGLTTRYAHLSELKVKDGEWVSQGHMIGASGRTGNAVHPRIRPHLHFEIRYRNQPLNPSLGLLDPKFRLQS